MEVRKFRRSLRRLLRHVDAVALEVGRGWPFGVLAVGGAEGRLAACGSVPVSGGVVLLPESHACGGHFAHASA